MDGEPKPDAPLPLEPVPEDITNLYEKLDQEEEEAEEEGGASSGTVAFQVDPEKIEIIQKRCIELDHPLLAEYDFRNDTVSFNI